MNLLDANISASQRELLRAWRIPFRQIGVELADQGIADADIVPLLHRHRGTTFFTRDQDFFRASLCHSAYCLVFLDLPQEEAAEYIRRFLRHREFHTQAQRMGIVARLHTDGVQFWRGRKRDEAEWA